LYIVARLERTPNASAQPLLEAGAT
jgi:hypothetical protein